jgi:hypothetical protein
MLHFLFLCGRMKTGWGRMLRNEGFKIQDWRQLFKTEKSLGSLQYFEPQRQNGRIIVQPPKEAIEERISKWSSSLIYQFMDKPLSFYVVKRTVENIWASFGSMELFL